MAAVIPPLLHNGVAFEAHPQNTLLRLSRSTLTPTGFVMRDLGGLRVHPATLATSITDSDSEFAFKFLPGHCVVTSTREEAAKKLYHTLVHNHLQRLARVLRLHSDGSAWGVVREHLTREISRGSWLWSVWMDDAVRSVSGKCLVRMKLEGVYREVSHLISYPFFSSLMPHFLALPSSCLSDTCLPHWQSVYEPFPNLIHHRPEETKGKGNPLYAKNISRGGKFLGLMCSAISLYFIFREK